MFDVVRFTLAASLATTGTVTVSYPTTPVTQFPRQKGNYSLSDGRHTLIADGNRYAAPTDFTLTFNANASNITLTWNASRTLPAGTSMILGMRRRGQDGGGPRFDSATVDLCQRAPVYDVDFGSPNTLSTTAICAAQAVGGAVNLTINGAVASGGVATNDCARALQAVSANAGDTTQTLTFTGTDIKGRTMKERITLNGTTPVFGKKAFKTVTVVASSASTAGNISVGNSDIIGSPVVIPNTGVVLKELQDEASATAGTVVKADASVPSLTTGDVFGTYDPNAACDGNKGFVLTCALPDPAAPGLTPFNA